MAEKKLFGINFSPEQLADLKEMAKQKKTDVASLVRDTMFNPPDRALAEAQEIYKGGIQQMQFINNNLQTLNRDQVIIFNKFSEQFKEANETTRKSFEAYHRKTEEAIREIKQEINAISGVSARMEKIADRLQGFQRRLFTVIFLSVLFTGLLTAAALKFFDPGAKRQKEILARQEILNAKHDDLVKWINTAREKRK